MIHPTTRRAKQKPAKPRPDFPLFPHATGRWAKKIRGKLHYFGSWDDPDGALTRYLDQKDDLHAGRTPRADAEGLTVADLANHFLTAKKLLFDNGELSPRTWADQYKVCERLVKAFGRNRLVSDLTADDFQRLRAKLSKTLNLTSLKVEIQRVRSVFKYGYDAGLIDKPVRFGPGFKVPSQRALLKQRQANGSRMFEPDQLRAILKAAKQPLRAMILLGVNAGFGNSDVATRPQAACDLENGWINFPRPKTGVHRRVPLWPETVAAIREALAVRPKPRDRVDADLVFLSSRGLRWVRFVNGAWRDNVTLAFRRLLRKLNLWRPGLSFYTLRHVFETVAGESVDQVAVDAIMGHHRGDMASVYRERISDERLRAVTDYVRKWLFGESERRS